MKKLQPVTDAWVKKHYDLDTERKTVKSLQYGDELTEELSNKMTTDLSTDEFLSMVKTIVEDFDIVQLDSSFSSGFTFELMRYNEVLEEDYQVITRLKEVERKKRRLVLAEEKERAEYERLKSKFEPDTIYLKELAELECSQCRMGKNYTGFCTMEHPKGECPSFVGKDNDS